METNGREAIEAYRRVRAEGELPTEELLEVLVEQLTVHELLAEAGIDTESNVREALSLYEETRSYLSGVDPATHAGWMLEQGLAHHQAGGAGLDPVANFERAIELFERARREGLEPDTERFGESYLRQGDTRKRLAELDVDRVENFQRAIDLFSLARRHGITADDPLYPYSLVNQANAYQQLGGLGVDPEENYRSAIDAHERGREGFPPGSHEYAISCLDQALSHVGLAERDVDTQEHYERAIDLFAEAMENGLAPGAEDFTLASEMQSYARWALDELASETDQDVTASGGSRPDTGAIPVSDGPTSDRAAAVVAAIREAGEYQERGDAGIDPENTYRRAIDLYEEIETERELLGDPAYALVLFAEANAHLELGLLAVDPVEHFGRAVELYDRSRRVRPGLDDETAAFALVQQMGSLNALARRGVEPRANYERVLDLSDERTGEEPTPGTVEWGALLGNLASAYEGLGGLGVDPASNFGRAIELYERSRQEGLEVGMPEYVESLVASAETHRKLGERGIDPRTNFEQSIVLYERCRREGYEPGTEGYADTFVQQSVAHHELGVYGVNTIENLERAIELQERARQAGLEPNSPAYGGSFLEQGATLRALGNFSGNPESYFEEAIECCERARSDGLVEGSHDYYVSLLNQANVHQELAGERVDGPANIRRAIALTEEVLAGTDAAGASRTTEPVDHSRLWSNALVIQSRAYGMLAREGIDTVANLRRSIDRCETALTEGPGVDARTLGVLLSTQAESHYQLYIEDVDPEVNYAEAETHYLEAIDAFERLGASSYTARAYTKLGGMYEAVDDLENAYDAFGRAIEWSEDVRATVTVADQRERVFGEYSEAYMEAVSIALRLGKGAEAFEYLERAKSRTFLDMIGSPQLEREIPPELLAREEQLRSEISWLLRQTSADAVARHVEYLPRPDLEASPVGYDGLLEPTDDLADQLESRLDEKILELEDVLEEIREADPEAYALTHVDPKSISEIQRTLSPGERLVEYFVYIEEEDVYWGDRTESVAAFVLDHEGLKYEWLPVTGPELGTKIVQYRHEMFHGDADAIREVCGDLYDWLIAPLAPDLTTDLIIVPHGSLHEVSFASLYDRESGQYFIESFTPRLAVSASAQTFIAGKSRDRQIESALVVGNPTGDLQHAQAEATAVASLFEDASLLTGEEATVEQVETNARRRDLIHLACHGYFNSSYSQYSGLLLADRWMYLDEILDLRLDASLVTLSACETAVGELSFGDEDAIDALGTFPEGLHVVQLPRSYGDEMESLSRAFQYAGAPTVIGSLWTVDDASTRYLFEEFYRRDGPFPERLREAQLRFLEDDRYDAYRHPYYWSGFVLYG